MKKYVIFATLVFKATTIEGMPADHEDKQRSVALVKVNSLQKGSKEKIQLARANDTDECRQWTKEIVRMNIKNEDFNEARFSNKQNFLMHATQNASYPILKQILNLRKANVDFQDEHGDTALIISSKMKDINKLRLLLEHGSDPNIKNYSKEDALIIAVNQGDWTAVELLLKYQADADCAEKKVSSDKYKKLREMQCRIKKEGSEIAGVMFFISSFVQNTSNLTNEQVIGTMKSLFAKLKEWKEVDSPIRITGQTVYQIAKSKGWEAVAKRLLDNVKEGNNDPDFNRIFDMLLKLKAEKAKELKKKAMEEKLFQFFGGEKSVEIIENCTDVPVEKVREIAEDFLNKLLKHARNCGHAISGKNGKIRILVKSEDEKEQLQNYMKRESEKHVRDGFRNDLEKQVRSQVKELSQNNRLGKIDQDKGVERLVNSMKKSILKRIEFLSKELVQIEVKDERVA